MKKFLLFMLNALFLLGSMQLSGQQIVEIGTGSTTTNSYLPLYSFYNNTLSEQIYTSSEIGMPGSITSIAFYNAGSTKSPDLKIYMVNTDKTEFSSTTDWIPVTASDLVYDGTSVALTAGQWTTIQLDNPFVYDGVSNLGLIVDAHLSYSSGLSCYVFTSTSNCAMYVYSDGTDYNAVGATYTASSRLSVKNHIKLGITPSTISCHAVTPPTVSGITATNATITWGTPEDYGTYLLQYKTSSEEWTDATVVTDYPVDSTYDFNDLLAPSTTYNVRIANMCSNGDTSLWRNITFTTACADIATIPHVENFDTYGTGTTTFPDCWTRFNNATSALPYVSTTHLTGVGSLYFYASSSTTYNMAVMPAIASSIPLNTLQVSFAYRASNFPDRLVVGVLDDITDMTTFTPVDTVYPVYGAPGTWDMRTVSFADYEGTGRNIAFLNTYTTTTGYAYIDSLVVDLISDCPAPNNVVCYNHTTEGADIDWTPGGDEGSWEVLVVPANADMSTGTPVTTSVHPYTINSLDDNTAYDVYVRAICGSGDNSGWSIKRTFTTNPNCSVPLQVGMTQIAGQSAMITWSNANFGATSYTVGWSQAGQDNWTTQTVTGTEYMISGLTPTTDYDAFVFSNCALGDPDTVFIEFTTKCLAGGNVEIGTGTSTTSSTPSYSYYSNSYSQQIYLASEMNGASNLNSVSFNMSTCNQPNRYWKIYLMHTTLSSTSSWLDASASQMVFHDSVTLHSGWNTFNFSTPFAYNGTDNLVLIVIDSSSTSGSYNYYRYTTTSPDYRARYYYSNSTTFSTVSTPSSGTNTYYRVNVIFGSPCDSTVTCIAPNPHVTAATDNSVTVAWVPGSTETSWELEYMTDGAWISEGSVTSPHTITGLSDNTDVTVRVRSTCGSGNNSEWAEIEARTACAVATLPLTEDFESSATGNGNMVDCWTARTSYSTTTNPNHYYPYVSTTYANSGSKAAYFYGTSAYYSYLASPEFDASVAMDNLQVRFWAYKSTMSYFIQVGVMTDPNDANTFVQVGEDVTPSTTGEWQMLAVNTDDYAGTGRYIAFRIPKLYANYMYVDDITIDVIPSCAFVDSLSVSDVGPSEATINWVETGSATAWDLAIVPGNDEVDLDTVSLITVSGAPGYTVNGLDENSVYTAYVRANCGTDGTSIWMSLVFMTAQTPATLPFFCDFENAADAASFAILNGNQPNKWVVGTATNNGGTHALYVSDDNGATNNYTIGTASTVWAYRDIEFPASPSGYQFSFDWHCYGESGYDFLNVYVGTPAMVSAGVPASLSGGNTAAPAGAVAILGNANTTNPYYFNLKTDYQSFTTNLPGLEETTVQRIYFLWRNDGSVGTQPPAAIDNISIAAINCDAPTALTVGNVTAYTADVSWTTTASGSVLSYMGANDNSWTEISPASSPETLTNLLPNTNYTVRVANICEDGVSLSPYVMTSFTTGCAPMTMANLPHSQNFDGVAGETSTSVSTNNLPSCWDYYNDCTNSSYTGYPMVYNSSSYAHSGSQAVRFYPYYGTQVAILPELDVTDVTVSDLRVSFYGRCNSTSYPLQVIVGVMSDPDSISTFVPTDTVSINTTTYTLYKGYLAGYTGDGGFVALRVNSTSSSSYYGYIDDVVLSEAPHCATPSNLTATFTTTEVTLNWDEIDGESNFQVYLHPANQTPDYTQAEQVTTNSYIDQNLESGSTYTAEVRTICSNGQGYSDWATITFTTMIYEPADVPYTHDFDDGTENASWTLVNGTQTNKWHIGKPANEADSVLFISDGTNTETYSGTASTVWAWRDLTFPTGAEFNLDIKWKALGESTWDYMRVFVGAPSDVTAGSMETTADDIFGILNQDSTWHHSTAILNGSYANSVQRLYLMWRNDGSVQNNPPVVVDSIVITVSNCGTPYNLVAGNITEQSADITFTPAMDGDGAWEYVYGEYPFAPSASMTETPQAVSASTFNLSGLTTGTHYIVYVRTVCGNGEYSAWSEGVDFFTPCSLMSVPYSENFNSYTTTASSTTAPSAYPNDVLPDCWTFLNRSQTSGTYPQAFLTSSSTYAVSGNCLFFKSSSTTPLYAILPDFSDPLQGLQITFTYRNEGTTSSNGTLSLGYMTNIADPSTFTEIAAYPMTTTLTEISEVLSVIPASVTNATLAFKYTGGTSNNYYLSIDNVLVETIPTCPKPKDLTATAFTTTSITLGWSANGSSATTWNIEYGPAGFTQGTGTTVQTSSNPHTINGLNPSSAYDFYVQGDCGGGDTSHWSNVFTTFTDCSTVDVLPYSESFDAYGASTSAPFHYPTCWTKINTYSSDRPYITTTHYDGIGSLYFYAGTSGTYNIGITPEFGSSIDISSLKASFMYKGYNNSDRLIVGVMTDNEDASTFVAIDTVYPTTGAVSTWASKEVSFANYTGNGKYIAFKNEYTSTYAYAYVDSLVIYSDSVAVTNPTVATNAATAIEQTTATLNATITNPDDVTITAKGFQWKATQGGTYTTVNGTGTGNSFTAALTNLTPNTEYTFKAFITFNGQTVEGGELTFTTQPGDTPEPCDVPTNLHTTDIQNESIAIAWDANPNVTSWNIQYRPVGGQLSSASSNTNSYTITGLTMDTQYEIQVQAVCANGTSDWCTAITATTTNVGIDNYLEGSVTLYPNPAKEVVNVQCTMNNVQLGGELHLFDVYGKLLQIVPITGETTQINVSGLANGMYFVRVTCEEGTVTKQFVKR